MAIGYFPPHMEVQPSAKGASSYSSPGAFRVVGRGTDDKQVKLSNSVNGQAALASPGSLL